MIQNLPNEIWKPIECFEELYHVSTCGRVKSLNYNHTKQEHILKPSISKGYLRVCLSKDGKHYMKFVHRLVAEAFLPNPLNLPCINHINEDKTDNRLQNIEWCDVAYNNSFGSRIERIAKANTNNPKLKALKNDPNKSKAVLQYSLDGTFIKEFPSAQEVKRQLGFSQGNISTCCLGKRKQAYGYKWLYKEDVS